MITGNIKSQIDQIWNAFWSGGISNPLEVIEQITYLLFLRRLDDMLDAREITRSDAVVRAVERDRLPGLGFEAFNFKRITRCDAVLLPTSF